jgi:urate oxidase
MKNFIQREALNFKGDDVEGLCRFLGEGFLQRYSQVEGLQVSAVELPYEPLEGTQAFEPGGPERATARIELGRNGLIGAASGLEGFRLLRLGGSAFEGFVRDEYTTLAEMSNRPLHMWLDVEWRYGSPDAAFSRGSATARVRGTVRDVFASFESRSIQQVIYQMGSQLLAANPSIAEVRLEATNRTWGTIAEQGETLGVYADAGRSYGCLGLTLTRT